MAHIPSPEMTGLDLDVRRHDRERFVTALFCPSTARDDVLAMIGFNAELARIRALIREPLAGAIRLQWWRDAVQGERPADETARHPIAQPLCRLIAQGRVSKDLLLGMVDARERDVEGVGFATMAELSAYAWATSGALSQSIARLSGAVEESSIQAAQEAAAAYALTGLVRSLRFHLSTGWMTLPRDALARAGLAPEDVKEGMGEAARLASTVQEIARHAQGMIERARTRSVEKAAVPACLTATLAGGHLKVLSKEGWNPFAPTVARPSTMPLRLIMNYILGRY